MNVLFCLTGSVASIKCLELAKLLKYDEHKIKIVATQNALNFIKVEEIQEMKIELNLDSKEWDSWKKRGDPVIHIEVVF